jgi:hypothetical protein
MIGKKNINRNQGAEKGGEKGRNGKHITHKKESGGGGGSRKKEKIKRKKL